eukprot:4659512-Prorocentrum_lima.AAC.1
MGVAGELADPPPSEARRRTYHADWKSTELSQFEVELYKATFYEESKVEQPKDACCMEQF